MGDAIPSILHQHFLEGEEAIPEQAREISHGLRAANPGWTYSFWDAARAEAFIRETYGEEILARYLRINPEYYTARSDLLRYLTLYMQGGVYLDIKSTSRFPLDEVVQDVDGFLLMNWNRGGEYRELFGLPQGEYLQWALVSVPGHPFLKLVIERVIGNIDRYVSWRDGVGMMGTLRLTGPIAFSLAVHSERHKYPHVYAASPDKKGLVYTGLPNDMAHRGVYDRQAHYTFLDTPLCNVSRTDNLIRETILRASRLPGVPALRRAVRPVRQSLRALIARRPT
jgi:hypothetical protein